MERQPIESTAAARPDAAPYAPPAGAPDLPSTGPPSQPAEGRARLRLRTYATVAAAMAVGSLLLRGNGWRSGPELHTVLESVSASVALVAGVLALARFQIVPRTRLLFIGSAFLVAGLLDAYHAFVTSPAFPDLVPTPPRALVPWSWLASRLALATLLAVGFFVGRQSETRPGAWGPLAKGVYALGAGVALVVVALLTFLPLPVAAYLSPPVARPQELLPGALFVVALAGHLREQRWAWDPVKHGLVFSLLLGAGAQILFMPFSRALYDGHFDAAHLLKLLSYAALFAGLLGSLLAIFRSEQESIAALRASRSELARHGQALEGEVARRTADLERSRARFRRISESNLLGIVFWDVRGRILEANDEFLRIVGYSRGDLEAGAVDWVRMTPPEHAASDDRALEEMARTGKAAPFEKEYWRKDGTRAPVLLGCALLEDSTEHGVAFALDISERVAAREALERLNAELEGRVREQTAELRAINHELEAFAYTVSHDLRAPLRQVDGFSRILLDEHGPELSSEARRLLGRVRDGAARMGTLVDELLEYSRLGRRGLEPEAVDTRHLVEEVIAGLARPHEGAPPARTTLGDLPPCRADPTLLRQVWANLLENAFKFTSRTPDPLVRVGSEAQDGHTVYYVADNGVGFDMRHADKLFGVFQRLHAADEFPGTGVGLATVHRIVHRHGGRVWARAAPGDGATFYFTLDTEPHP
ncbi:MAG: hypothetical protein AMXMBFR53_27020 [Gemmatimonadota bacterium]